MIYLLVALAVVLLIWLISIFIQRSERKTKERIVQQHLEEKRKEEEAQNKSPLK